MNSNKGQFAAVLLLMLALFMYTDSIAPDTFAGSEEPIAFEKEKSEIEFRAVLDSNSFSKNNELLVKTSFINKGKEAVTYFPRASATGINGVLGAAIVSAGNDSRFTHKLALNEKPCTSIINEGILMPGEALSFDFNMLPYYKDNGSMKRITPGSYVLKLWYNKTLNEMLEVEFPIKVVSRFGIMHIESGNV